MNNLNSILIEGNITKDADMRTTVKRTPVCNFQINSARYYRKESGMEKEVSFFFFLTWGRLAEECNSMGKKGRGVRVVGRLKQYRWTGDDGKTHGKIVIVAEHIDFRPEYYNEH
jgi:single-strand DNA-binding protein